jgi:hypothetical protein
MTADDDRPPVLGSWRALYALVLGALGATIALFAVVSHVYR